MLDHNRPLDTRFAAMLAGNGRLRGIFNTIPSPAIVEMCGYAGFDFIIIDNEHGAADLMTTEHMLRAARGSGIVPIVRCLPQDVGRTLDLGPSGLQIPMVGSAEEAAHLVRLIKYPHPDGKGGVSDGLRGSGFSSRAAGYAAYGGDAHAHRSNDGVTLTVQIESPEGVANAAAIAAVPGINAVFVGTHDLAHTMGHESNVQHPAVQAAVEKTLKAIAAAGKCAGIPAPTAADEERYASWGARMFANGTAGPIMKALREAAKKTA